MIKNDRVYGVPLVQYKDTKANITALSGVGEGAIAYATDTNEFGSYDGTTWTWGQGGSFDLAAAIHAATEETSLHADDEVGIWEHVSGLLRKVKFSTWITDLGAYFVSHSSSTASNDFLVGSGTGAWIKKTLAQTITILRTSLDSVYAALSHTHAASDITSGLISTARLGGGSPSGSNYLRGDSTYATPKGYQLFMAHGLNGTVPASTTYYLPLGYFGLNATGYNFVVARSGTIKNLSYRHNSAQPASGSLVITVNKNGVNSALQITVTSATPSPTTQSDTTHSFSVVAGDVIVIEAKNNATAASGQVGAASFEFEYDAG